MHRKLGVISKRKSIDIFYFPREEILNSWGGEIGGVVLRRCFGCVSLLIILGSLGVIQYFSISLRFGAEGRYLVNWASPGISARRRASWSNE